MIGLRFEMFQGPRGLDRLAKDWRRLIERLNRPSYLQLWEWHRSYLQNLSSAPGEALFCALYDGTEPIAIVPLEKTVTRVMGLDLDALSLPSHAHMPHSDLLLDSRARSRVDLRALVRSIAGATGKPWDVILLGPTLADSNASSLLAAQPMPMCVTGREGASYALPAMAHDKRLDGLSKNSRTHLRRARNKLNKLAGVRVVSARTPEELDRAFALFLEVEASGWKGTKGTGTAIGLDPSLRAFYGELVAHLGPVGQCEIHLLEHDARPIAVEFALRAGERCYLLKFGYDETYGQLAPGHMLLESVLMRYQADPVVRYVDLVSAAAWFRSWNPVTRDVLSHYLFQPTPRGLAAWSARRGKEALRPLYRRLQAQRQELERRVAVYLGRPHAERPAQNEHSI